MIALLAWLCVLPPALALLYLGAEVLFGLGAVETLGDEGTDLDVVVIVPAHNEASGIGETVRSVLQASPLGSRVLVVADNCSDETAGLARAAGASVIERNDPERRGKGYALAFARDHLACNPPTAVFVLDADCRLTRGSPNRAASEAMARGAPVQARNLLCAPPGAPPLVGLSNFAFLLKNLVRSRGMYRLGGGTTLSGTGMAFPWNDFAQAELATADAVEDLRLSLVLALEGKQVHLCEETQVISSAAEQRDSLSQRRRWEHGFLAQALRRGVPLLLRGMRRGSRHLLALGAHMLVPPLALLLLIALGALLPALGALVWAGYAAPAIVLLASLAFTLATVALAWHLEGRTTLSAGALVKAPLYVLWKAPLYLGFFARRQTEWNRTRRFNERS